MSGVGGEFCFGKSFTARNAITSPSFLKGNVCWKSTERGNISCSYLWMILTCLQIVVISTHINRREAVLTVCMHTWGSQNSWKKKKQWLDNWVRFLYHPKLQGRRGTWGFVEKGQDGSRLCRGEGRRPDLSGIVVLTEAFQLSLSCCRRPVLKSLCHRNALHKGQVLLYFKQLVAGVGGKRVVYALAES